MTTPPKPLIAGNWKMNGLRDGATALLGGLIERSRPGAACDILVCPPATLLGHAAVVLAGSPIALGGQDCHPKASGAHTGDIGAPMLADAGCTYVIVGHSERRTDHGETDALVRAKAEAAHGAGLTAIVCVGETLEDRDAGRALDVVLAQLAGSLPPGADSANSVIAYEPVWAIGTGRTPTVADIAEIHGGIRTWLQGAAGNPDGVRILYGGSAKPDNAEEILAVANVDGALVGGASLKADDFWAICRACG